jgi:3-methylfumaryl-CoA hydratase
LVLAEFEHALGGPDGPVLTETQKLVFRQMQPYAANDARGPAEKAPVWRRTVVPDEVLLFSFSALTANAHRIHYDLPYARDVEGYPGLVVQGPLTCILLLDLIRRFAPERTLESFEYRALQPLFCGHPIALCGLPEPGGLSFSVWAENEHGIVAMRARGTWRPV